MRMQIAGYRQRTGTGDWVDNWIFNAQWTEKVSSAEPGFSVQYCTPS